MHRNNSVFPIKYLSPFCMKISLPGLSLKMTPNVVATHQNHVLLLWRVIIVKFNIGKKITDLEIVALNHQKI